MENLMNAKVNHIYQVHSLTIEGETKNHLQAIGIVPGSKISLLELQGQSGIVLMQKSRIALDSTILEKIYIEEIKEKQEWLPLDQLKVGEYGKVVSIHGKGAIRRRLMDMGMTKNVKVYIQKLAPLGDPIEVTLRGYDLSLRKDEASLVLVQKELG
ncbi:ferrous iron transport protein A [Amphibacillus sp. MSJ-3]|uniref:FeoA family protein n=1 Tax=Amphibacillus sp. MSJ-3 TaxID=2841505 RepID=UPI001C0EE516|nr:ferrous iron transport protein A [Amphibacillus sp. MSJ-3]MBU5595254.1 ferrous iron transport protein A [Amphibacillus sp. MSJ-3]